MGKQILGKNGNGNDAMGVGGSGNLKTHSRTPLLWIKPSDANDRSNWREMIRGNCTYSNNDSEVMG